MFNVYNSNVSILTKNLFDFIVFNYLVVTTWFALNTFVSNLNTDVFL